MTEKKIFTVDDFKRDYVIRSLSRTKRKDYENYVINAIWNRLRLPDLKPVTQAYAPSGKNDGKYYLVDLYFPQLGMGIECDEGYHIENEVNDKNRELDIQEMFRRVGVGYVALHIKVYDCDLAKLDERIDDVVETLRRRHEELKASGEFREWQYSVNPVKEAEQIFGEKDAISVDDDFVFPTIALALNTVLGSDYKMVQRGFFYPTTAVGPTDKLTVWMPKLATKVDEKRENAKAVGQFKNVLSTDGKLIYESSTKGKSMRPLKRDLKARKPRLTFGRVKDPVTRVSGWKFIGVFQYKESNHGENTFEKISDSFQIVRGGGAR